MCPCCQTASRTASWIHSLVQSTTNHGTRLDVRPLAWCQYQPLALGPVKRKHRISSLATISIEPALFNHDSVNTQIKGQKHFLPFQDLSLFCICSLFHNKLSLLLGKMKGAWETKIFSHKIHKTTDQNAPIRQYIPIGPLPYASQI